MSKDLKTMWYSKLVELFNDMELEHHYGKAKTYSKMELIEILENEREQYEKCNDISVFDLFNGA